MLFTERKFCKKYMEKKKKRDPKCLIENQNLKKLGKENVFGSWEILNFLLHPAVLERNFYSSRFHKVILENYANICVLPRD